MIINQTEWRLIVIENVKLGDIADIITGLVVKRKEAAKGYDLYSEYKLLTLKSINQNGWFIEENLEKFKSLEEIDQKYLTSAGDVIVRMSYPYTSISISKKQENMVVPSLFVIVRTTNKSLLPEYISLYLNSDKMKKQYSKESSGSVIQTLKTSSFKNLEIPFLELNFQEKAIQLNDLMKKEKILLLELMEQKELLNNSIMTQILTGGYENGRN